MGYSILVKGEHLALDVFRELVQTLHATARQHDETVSTAAEHTDDEGTTSTVQLEAAPHAGDSGDSSSSSSGGASSAQ